ncbi:DUF6896 domain-containing protein [Leucothrix arctica]|uniref:DUF6896 domain-containing protein n=1 Tax=Leucothrix arctica TaxID=1481894 RepID=A0A317C930_9GAMM|nr:hypothetical protein [Leucothrix arctica]PWQ94837.1 hypothetical protein DKT75_13880 [Leucothrix arctica]
MCSSNLKTVIECYLADVRKGMVLFKEKIGDTHPLSAWRNGGLPQNGKLSENIEYEFHGIGCLLIFSDHKVDFDFGYGGRIDGFDLWRLSLFVESFSEKYPYYKNNDLLKRDFELSVKKRDIGKLDNPHCNLYYCLHDN